MSDIPIPIAMVFSILAFILLYKPFFGKKNDFWECVMYSLTPDFFSWMAGNLQKDYGKSLKLSFFMFFVVGDERLFFWNGPADLISATVAAAVVQTPYARP